MFSTAWQFCPESVLLKVTVSDPERIHVWGKGSWKCWIWQWGSLEHLPDMGMPWGFDLTANNLNKTSALCHINHSYSVPIRVPLPFPLKMFSKLYIWQIATFFSGLLCKLAWIICLGFCRHPFSPACGVIIVLFGAKAFQAFPWTSTTFTTGNLKQK